MLCHDILGDWIIIFNISHKRSWDKLGGFTQYSAVRNTAVGQAQGAVAVIIDEYDKPIVDLLDDLTQVDLVRTALKNFYSAFKAESSTQILRHMEVIYLIIELSILNELSDIFSCIIRRYLIK